MCKGPKSLYTCIKLPKAGEGKKKKVKERTQAQMASELNFRKGYEEEIMAVLKREHFSAQEVSSEPCLLVKNDTKTKTSSPQTLKTL